MSEIGRLCRGWKWYGNRNPDGVLPKEIVEDPAKMCDVNTYTEFIEGKEDLEKIKGVLGKFRFVKKSSRVYEDLAGQIGYERDVLIAADGSSVIIFKKKAKVETKSKKEK